MNDTVSIRRMTAVVLTGMLRAYHRQAADLVDTMPLGAATHGPAVGD